MYQKTTNASRRAANPPRYLHKSVEYSIRLITDPVTGVVTPTQYAIAHGPYDVGANKAKRACRAARVSRVQMYRAALGGVS